MEQKHRSCPGSVTTRRLSGSSCVKHRRRRADWVHPHQAFCSGHPAPAESAVPVAKPLTSSQPGRRYTPHIKADAADIKERMDSFSPNQPDLFCVFSFNGVDYCSARRISAAERLSISSTLARSDEDEPSDLVSATQTVFPDASRHVTEQPTPYQLQFLQRPLI